MRKFRHGDYLETERKTRVKMYKAGKSWVKSCLSQFGLLRFFGKSPVIEHIESSQVEDDASTDKKEYLFKGLTALGALAGGAALTTPQVNADELPKEKVLEKETLVNTDSAALKAAESTTETVQESELTQEASENIDQSASASISASESASISESISISESESLSVSDSLSVSESAIVSSSESAAISASESTSTSESESESDTSQGSESVADHEVKVADDESASRSQSDPRVANGNKAAVENVPAVQNDGTLRSVTPSENTYEVNGVDLPEVPVNNFVARTASDAAELAGAGSLNQGKTKAEVDRQASDLQAGLERSTAQEDDRSQAGYYAAVSNLAGNKAQVKEDLEKALAHNAEAASDLASYKSRIDAANTIEEIGAVVKEAQTKYPAANVAPQEETPEEKAQKESQLNSAKASAKTSAQAILDARAQANNSQATGADPAHVAAVQAKIDAAQSTAEVDKIISDLNDSASADTILVPKTDQDGRRYFEDIDTGKKYYLEPNWNEDSIKGQNSMRWELEPGQQLRVINNPSEPLSVQQLKYKGFHETADGDQVIDMMYTHTPRSAYVWTRLNLRISDDLQKRIDWTKSYYEDRNGNVYRFINGSQANDKLLVLSNLETGTETKRSPIRLYLRDNVTRAELDTIDTTIQARLLDANGNVYTKYMGGTNDSNMSLTGYGSYTQSVTIPKTTSTNLKSGLNPYLQVISSVDQAPDFVSSQNTVSYNPSENKLYVASQFHKKDTDNRNEKLNGQSIAYRLAFDKELLDVLKEDDYGYIGYVEPSITSGMKGAVNPNNVRTGFTRNQVNVVGDMAYVIYAPNEFDYNDETGQIIYANKGTQGFIDNISTELSGQQFTLTTLNVDSDNLKKLYPTINDQQPEMTAISVHSAMIIENDHGIDRVKMTTDQEAVARQGDKIEIRFAKPTNHGVKRSDLIDGEILYWNESAAKLAMKAGEAPIIGHLGVYPASRGARGSDARYDFAVNANNTVYTYTLPHDFKLAAGSEISLYTGANGKLVDNSGEVYINGVKVAEFGPGQAETSYAPRLIIGTEVNSSALLDRTQYMPVIKDMYDFDKVITGYTYVPNQLVEISYIDANSGQTRYVRTMSGNAAEPGASYTVEGDKTYPEPGKGLYKFEYAIPDTDRVVKDSPIVARSFNYQSAKDAEERALAEDEEAIQTSVGSDAVIARVLIQVTYDLNQPNGTSTRRVMTYAAPVETTDAAGNTTAIENSDVPRNEDFSNEVGYTNNGLEGNMANDPTLEGYRFLGWNTAQDGSGDFVTPETAFQNSTTVYAQWEKVSMAEEFEPGYDNISVEEGQAGTVNAPTFVKNGQAANPEVLQYTTSASGVTVNNDGSITVPASLTEGKAGQTLQIPVTITYGDNSTDTVDVYVDVTRKPENELYNPTVTPVEKDYGQPTTEDEIKNAVTVPSYEENPSYPGQTPTVTVDDPATLPDGNTPGEHKVPVTVTYPDGTKDNETVTVTVKPQPENDKYTPEVTPINKDYGQATTEDEVKNAVNVPAYEENPSYPGQTPTVTVDDPATLPDGNTPGEHKVPVTVTYPDGTKDNETVTVTVKPQPENDKYTPEVTPINKDYGQPTSEDEIKNSVTVPAYEENPSYPGQTPTVTIDDPSTLPDGNTPGDHKVPVTVTYPDGTEDKETVTVTVKPQPENDKYTPEVNPVEKDYGQAPTEDEIKNAVTVPGFEENPSYPGQGPTVTVDDPNALPDGNTSGDHEVPVTVTYPDGTEDKETVTVTVKPQPENDKYTPEVAPVEKDYGQAPTEDEIKNAVTVPSYEENPSYPGQTPTVTIDDPSTLPDGNTPGEHTVPVTVTYPDGTKDQADVTVTVKMKDKAVYDTAYPAVNHAESGQGSITINPTIFTEAEIQDPAYPNDPLKTVTTKKAMSDVPTGTRFAFQDSNTAGVTTTEVTLDNGDKASINPITGEITYTPAAGHKEDSVQTLPTIVTSYPTGQVDHDNVTVNVEKDNDSLSESASNAESESTHSLSEAMSQAASASAYSTSVANSESAHSASVAASQSAHSASVATSEAVSQVASTSVAASESGHSLSEAMSQAASASAYSTSVANSESAHSASVAASESAHSASVATSEAVSQVASTSMAASESAHSLSEAMSQAASASAYSTSVANSESAYSTSVATSESAHSASVAASESAHSASVATSEAVSQAASTSVEASESTHSLSEAMSQAASASAYSTSVANSESGHSASVATSEAVSQVASTSVAASESAHSASVAASESAHSLSEAMSQAASASAYSTSVANSESAHSGSVAASQSAHSLSEAMSQAASASAYSTSVANSQSAYSASTAASESAHSASVAASQSAHSASVATSEAVSQVASTSVAASESAHSASVVASQSAHSASVATSEAVSQVASTSVAMSQAASESAHSAFVAASESAHSASVATSEAVSQVASTSVAASESAHSASVAASQSAHSASVATSEAVSQVTSTSVAMSQAASESAHSASVTASQSAHSASVATSEAVSQVTSTSVAMSQAASASAHSTSVANSQSAFSASTAASESAHSASVAASQSAHSASVATSEAVSQIASTSVAASDSAHSASVAISELMSQLTSASTAASESAHSASVATSEAVSQVASTSEAARDASVAASTSAHSLSEAMSQAASASAYSTSVANSQSAYSTSAAASESAHSLSEAMSQVASASAYSTSVANSESVHSASVAASESAHSASMATSEAVSQVTSTSVVMSQAASASAYSTSVANSQSAYSVSTAASESAHSASVAISELLSQLTSASAAASESAHSASVATSEAVSQVASTSLATSQVASELAHSLSEAMSQAASASAYSTSVANSESAQSASVAISEAISQVTSTSITMSQIASASDYSTSVAHSESTHSLSVAMSEIISEHVSLSELDSRSDSQLASQLTSTSIEQSATISEQNSVIASLLSETQSQAPTSESDSSSEVYSHGPGWIESELPEFDIESFSASLSASESESLEASISASQSESASISLSQTVSTSESISLSESASISASQSASLDHVAPDSESDYHSGSEDSTASEASSSEVTSTRDEFSESAGVTPPTIIDSSHSGSAIDHVDSASASSSASQSDQASLIASDERRPSKQNAVAKPSAQRQQSVATNQVLPKTGAVSPLLTPGLLFVFAGLGIVSKKRKEK